MEPNCETARELPTAAFLTVVGNNSEVYRIMRANIATSVNLPIIVTVNRSSSSPK